LIEKDAIVAHLAEFESNLHWFVENKKRVVQDVVHVVRRDGQSTHVCAIVNQAQMQGILRRVMDPEEFLSPWGLRSLSRHHLTHPFRFGDREVCYEPAEARSGSRAATRTGAGPCGSRPRS